MGGKYKILHTIIFLLATYPSVLAQQQAVTTQGRDFWLVFLPNITNHAQRSIVVAAEEAATVTIAMPIHGWDTTMVIEAGEMAQINVDNRNVGYHVTSTSDVVVYASNYIEWSFDIATVYPTSVLRSHYMVQCYANEEQNEAESEIGIVAVEDNTHVTLQTPSGAIVRSFTMMAGQVELYGNTDDFTGASHLSGNMTGITIEADDGKPLAVFQGNKCMSVGLSACDHLYEQSVPTDYWGREFIVVPIAGRLSYDVVRITSLEDFCRVAVNDTFAVMLDAGESYSICRNDIYKISAMKPVTVCLYMSGDADSAHLADVNLIIGDPSAVIIPPLEQSLQHTIFHAYNTFLSNLHYANIVVKGCATDGMLLDGEAIGWAFTPFNDEYSYAQLSVSPGIHTLSNNMGLFQAWFYGMGQFESYAYIAGMAMTDFDHKLFIDSMEVNDVSYLCAGDSILAKLQTSNGFRDTRWYLDDTLLETTALQLPLYFDSAGNHTLKALLHGDCCQQWCDSLEVTLQVHPYYSFEEEVRFCEGTPYPWHDTVLFEAGIYSDSLSTVAGCDSVFSLHLEALNVPQPGIAVETDCFDHIYRLSAEHLDTLQWNTLQWSFVPDIAALHGHESDSVIEFSPYATTIVTLHVESDCPADSVMMLNPIVWPVAKLSVRPELLLLGKQSSFDAYDVSLDATSREWEVNGVTLDDVSNPLHYDVKDLADSILVVLTAVNDYCHDTASAVVRIVNKGLYIPNVFTPGESSNNRFTVVASDEIEGELTIYNREGLLVFQTADLSTGWDGSGCIQGAYVWHLHYRYTHAPKEWHKAVGTVTLLR